MAQPQPGDVLVREGVGPTSFVKVRHYGIYVGDGLVIHACICARAVVSQTFVEFSGGKQVWVSLGKNHVSSTRQVTVARAKELLGQPYTLTVRNCEHVVTYCVTGKASSQQLQGWLFTAGAVGVGLLLASRSNEDELESGL